uniref:Uncharacterized protein n=1 Tax=Pseudo-nitzschia australis TaxID=44445 RepID=A0A7S4ERD8_9STRA|mmetsp:Transcript_4957/g.11009  ORF Transcript_4957/g.11009 Transcript_4957/m.11009 type:complete len:351 (+) Transcript_4957:343-1395(+)|eukprot:CAMPEP_0168192716 /NCGR_PEP_ID=MMETSP0139_2-20121125/18200_1 /TAXON_ID=44445 /ORGANISM="Pseudo-nitzschia australis, Strain 10249 10 AB" /LENGTH=350 /DNA_ID=CAMNT_0008115981 /DNA_START=268 /DNA_END=1320 /DNA_ORIENTATION=+
MRSFNGVGSMGLAIAFATLALIPNAEATTFVIPALDHPWRTTTVESMTTGTAKTKQTLLDLRGGGLFGGGNKKSTTQIYRESLEEQVVLLNEQLRRARTDVTMLRENAKKRQEIRISGRSAMRVAKGKSKAKLSREEARARKEKQKEEDRLEKQRQKEQEEILLRSNLEISQLEKMKAELETLLETSARKIEELEQQLRSQETLTVELEASYQKKIAKLELQLNDVQTSQLEKLEELHQQRIDAAVKEALNVQEKEFAARMEDTTKRLTKEYAKAMEDEKLRSSKAVETERKKMRKLVRALALREKKLKLQSDPTNDDETTEKTTTTTSVRTGSSSFANPIKPPTGRGTI